MLVLFAVHLFCCAYGHLCKYVTTMPVPCYSSFCVSKRLALQALDPSNGGSSSSNGGSSDSSHQANLLAASIGAIATALVESPVELFRHQAQAGAVNGNFVQAMVDTVRKQVSAAAAHLVPAVTRTSACCCW